MNSSPPVIFEDLKVGYDQNLVLHGISATIETGTCVAITGNNGSGKSTLLKSLLGIVPITSGEISIFGTTLTANNSPTKQVDWTQIGYVPQRVSVGGGISSTVKEVVETGMLGPKRWWLPHGSSATVKDILEQVGLAHRANEAFQILSGGQQQRVLIARALIRNPSLLLLDEPLTGLDSHNRQVLTSLIADNKSKGNTSLIVLHELGELAPLIDRELRLSAGHLVHNGPCTHVSHDGYAHHPTDSESIPPASALHFDISSESSPK